MERENKCLKMEISIKGNEKMGELMGKEPIYLVMGISTMEFFRIIVCKVIILFITIIFNYNKIGVGLY